MFCFQSIGAVGLKLSINSQIEAAEEQSTNLPRPDFSQMIPYKPKLSAFPGEHPLAGGTFPQPPALAALCSVLPPPTSFQGPFVAVDMLIDIFNQIQLADGECFLVIE